VIRLAKEKDLDNIQEIYVYARKFMAEHGNPTQWGQTRPTEETLRKDIEKEQLYVIEERDRLQGVFALIIGEDPTYQNIEQGSWKDTTLYGTIHRIASASEAHGIMEQVLAFAWEKIQHLRIDTHENNKVMQHLILKNGFEKCGIIYVDDGSPRVAFEKTSKEEDEKKIAQNPHMEEKDLKESDITDATEIAHTVTSSEVNTKLQIRIATPLDAKEILDIYAPYILQTAITFEYEVPTLEAFTRRIEQTLVKYPYLVAEQDGRIVGYAYAGPLHERAAYDWAVETSIYVKMDAKGQGIGKKLYVALEEALLRQHIVCVNACIAYPDQEKDVYLTKDSVDFHAHQGYKMVGEFHQCAYKFDHWYNMVWMEKSLCERPQHPEPMIWFSRLRKKNAKTEPVD
jgi:L-amino acid N-acyltransferase YncA/predicted GNAT family N-acyltransferase